MDKNVVYLMKIGHKLPVRWELGKSVKSFKRALLHSQQNPHFIEFLNTSPLNKSLSNY
jgi:hypothetical protein